MSSHQPAHRLRVFAGSSDYLVYARYPTGHALTDPGTLTVLTRSGQHRVLGTIPADIHRVQLVGSMVVAVNGGYKHRLSWWNLATGASGATLMDEQDSLLGAAPNGWLVMRSPTDAPVASYALDEVASAGETTQLSVNNWGMNGVPDVVDANGLLIGDIAGGLGQMPWSNPGEFRQVLSDAYVKSHFPGYGHSQVPSFGQGVACQSMDSTVAACIGSTRTKQVILRVPLDGGKLRTHVTCGSKNVVVTSGSSVVWINRCNDRLQELTTKGKVVTSLRTFDSTTGAHRAFGKLIVLSKLGKAIEELSSLNAKPKVLVRAS